MVSRINVFLASLGLMLGIGSAHGFDLGSVLKKTLEQGSQQQQNQPSNANLLIEGIGVLAGSGGISEAEEAAIGQQIAGNLLGAAPLVKDPQLQKYVNDVGRWVASQSERPNLEWHFGVIESNDINAFAAPGGYIFVTRGLYKLLGNEAELAGVLGHEIGHVIRKHHLKILQQSKMVSLGGKLLARKAGGDNQRVQGLIGSGAEIVARGLDKGAEFEADRIGMVLSARAGYDAFGLPEVLQQIGHVGAGDSSVALLFKTHPHPDDRLAKLGDAVDERFDGLQGKTLANRFYRLKP
ncbi:MAG: M48 family metallopeptidase [Betaproteobacteria bacterium]